jgi:hypothetical protein
MLVLPVPREKRRKESGWQAGGGIPTAPHAGSAALLTRFAVRDAGGARQEQALSKGDFCQSCEQNALALLGRSCAEGMGLPKGRPTKHDCDMSVDSLIYMPLGNYGG